MKIKNSVAFVTEVDHGLGLWLAMELLARGARKVYAGVPDLDTFRGHGIIPIRIDFNDRQSIEAAAARCQDVSLLFNNAGIARPAESTLDPAMWFLARETFETDFQSVLSTTRAFAPALLRNGGGAVVNVLSYTSWVRPSDTCSLSRHEVASWRLSNALELELRNGGTQVLTLHLGLMDKDMAMKPAMKRTRPTQSAARILDALEAGEEKVLADEERVSIRQGLDPMVSTTPSCNG